MTEQVHEPEQPPRDDPDADPENLQPRDDREVETYEGDPDADPGNVNPRDPQ